MKSATAVSKMGEAVAGLMTVLLAGAFARPAAAQRAATVIPEPMREVPSVSGAPFVNADFEHGDFRNWPVHDGWVLQDFGDDADVTGFFSAFSLEGTHLVGFYLNRDVNHYPKRLVSVPFRVAKPFLTFHVDGNIGYGTKRIGVDTTGDEQADVLLSTRGLRPGRAALDLSAHLGRDVTFIVTVEKPKGPKVDLRHASLAIDELLLEESPPAAAALGEFEESRETIRGQLRLSNPYSVGATGRGAIRVVNHWGMDVLNQRYQVELEPKEKREVAFAFPNDGAPQYRILATRMAANAQIIENLHRRYHTVYRTNGRPSLRLDEKDWSLALSKERAGVWPSAESEWTNKSPYKFNGPAYWRHGAWTEYEDYAQHWYRRRFTLPPEFEGKRAVLRIDGAFGPITVFANRRQVGEYTFRGRARRLFDLGDALRAGTNTVTLRFRNPNVVGRDENEKAVYPYEMRFTKAMLGIWGNVSVEAVPDVWVDHLLIDPSWRTKSVNVRVALDNASSAQTATVTCAVHDSRGQRLLAFEPRQVEAAPGRSVAACSASWPEPVVWSPDDPTLLRLTVSVGSAGGTDTVHERFGFAEWYPEGTRYMLNGRPVTLFASHAYDPRQYASLKRRQGVNSLRGAGSFESADACDEIGVSFRAIYAEGRCIDSDEFLRVQREQTLTMMQYYYNHPSLFLWAVGNELGYRAVGPNPKLREFYRDLIVEMQNTDPARASSADGDLDMWGASELWSIHYPHEAKYEEPNRGYFIKPGVELMDWFAHPPYQGRKPVMMTEVFTGGLGGPDWYAPLQGNDAYTPFGVFEGYRTFAQWRMRAYREQDVALFEPFEPYAYYRNFWPLDLFLKSYSRNVYAGETKTVEAVLLNGYFRDQQLELAWRLGDVDGDRRPITLEPGHATQDVTLHFPAVAERTELPLTMWLLRNGQPFVRWGTFKTTFNVFPTTRLAGRVACWDADGPVGELLRRVGLEAAPVDRAADLADHRLLVADTGVLAAPEANGVREWVHAGGYAMVLAHERDVARLPGKLKLSRFSNTMAHVAAPHHPILAGFGRSDFRHWGADHHVSHQAFLKPEAGGAKVLIENGTPNGLTLASLVEVRRGRGAWLLSSLLLDKPAAEPLVKQLLRNVRARAARPMPETARTGLLVSDTLTRHLAAVEIVGDDLAQIEPADIDLASYGLLIVDARIANVDVGVLRDRIEAGARLMLLRLTPDNLARYRSLLPEGLTLTRSDDASVTGAAVLRAADDPLIDGISNYELLWKRGNYQRGGPKFRITTVPADYDLAVPDGVRDCRPLLAPAVLARFGLGRGQVVLSQFRWEEGLQGEQKAAPILATLLSNLGSAFRATREGSRWAFSPVALRGTTPLTPDLFEGLKAPVALLRAPSATRLDVPFRLPAPAGSAIALEAAGEHGLPETVSIPVNARADRVAFLHATAFGYVDYDMGKNVSRYLVALKQGNRTWVEEVNAIYARNIYEYIGDDPGTINAATQASRSSADGVSTYLLAWDNPAPDAMIERVEARSLDNKIVTVLFGLTLMRDLSRQGVLERRRRGPFSVTELETDTADTPGRRWAILGAIPPSEQYGLNQTARDAEGARKLYDEAFPVEGKRQIDLAVPVFVRGNRFAWKAFVEPEEVDTRGTYVKYRCIRIDDIMDKGYLGKSPAWACYFHTRIYRDIYSGAPQKTAIAFGSDDAAKIWVNGKLVHEIWAGAGRASILGEDLVFADLYRGWNEVLVKIVNTQFSGAFSFDLKEPGADMVQKWRKKGPQYLQALPPISKTSYDCFGKRTHGDARSTISRVLSVELNGQSHELEGLKKGDVTRDGEGVFRVSWPNGGAADVWVEVPQKAPGFRQGTFGVAIRVPRGKAVPKLLVAARNAGGVNRGDTFIYLRGGRPAGVDGAAGPTGKPYSRLALMVDRDPHSEAPTLKANLPLTDGFPEGVWVPLSLRWGNQGVSVMLNGEVIRAFREDTPLFVPHVGVSLFSSAGAATGGEVHFRNAFLTDRVLTPEQIATRLE